MERFARATAVAAALASALFAAPARSADPSSTRTAVGDAGAEVVFRALSLLGVNYRWGGNSPETGLDCSGLVRLVYSDALGLPLPRRSEEISRVGPAVAPAELQPGDLVFFNTLRRTFSHVGIYIGNNQFVHAPSTGGSIRVENLGADYWSRRFDGARRLLTHDLLAAASRNPLSSSAARALQASAIAAAPQAAAAPLASSAQGASSAPAASPAQAAWTPSFGEAAHFADAAPLASAAPLAGAAVLYPAAPSATAPVATGTRAAASSVRRSTPPARTASAAASNRPATARAASSRAAPTRATASARTGAKAPGRQASARIGDLYVN